MFKLLFKITLSIFFNFCVLIFSVNSEIIKNIEISGNERIADETIVMFSKIKLGTDLSQDDINNILKEIYETNFFQDVSVSLKNNKLVISVIENPIIENIKYNGIKSNTMKELIVEDLNLISRSSFNEVFLEKDKNKILSTLKELGYYFAEIEIELNDLDNNKIDLIYNISLGDKAKIKKISFIGDKIFKDNKLRNIIISEEYKFWKFISGKKYLNENLITFDKRLLKNFYLNKGYYDVEINSSFAKLVDQDSFELVYTINAKEKFYFGKLELSLPIDFDNSNFNKLVDRFKELENEPYSINSVESILKEIDKIAVLDQYETIKASVVENILDNKINLDFKIEETKRYIVEKINIFGNNVTRENVIRNKFLIDEGDPYNQILTNRTINEIKSLNFFREVNSNIVDGSNSDSKIINIIVEEKPTGEIMAGAGFGTGGEIIEIGVKENNYLGKGLSLDTNLSLGSEKVSGVLNVLNPNVQNSDKSLNFGLQANETDRLSTYGYKSKKIGGFIGTGFEYLEDFYLGLRASSFIEDIETDTTASSRQKKQAGDYFDTYVRFNFDYDKRNQKFKTSDGFRSFYTLDLPVISKTNTVTNSYTYKTFSELYENNVTSLSLSLSAATSVTGDDIKLSERLTIPSRKLRGFVRGKVGPKDGSDYIGGNYYAVMNINSSLPNVLPNAQNIEIGSFIDIGNIWGVDDDALDDSNTIRSSVGIGIDWFTPVGPLSFSLSQPVTKGSTDKTESFRFNLGTTF